jgi:DNA-binding NtrC family response regulator
MPTEAWSGARAKTVLLLVEEPALRARLARGLDGSVRCIKPATPADALVLVERHEIDVVIVTLPGISSGEITEGPHFNLEPLRRAAGDAPLLAVGGVRGRSSKARAEAADIWDFIHPEAEAAEIRVRVGRAIEHRRLMREVARLQSELERRHDTGSLVGSSPPMERLRSGIRRLSALETPVVLVGETGCGRDRVARAIHFASSRRHRPFVAVSRDAPGRPGGSRLLDEVAGGTIFVDHVDSLKAAPRQGLLRLLATHAGKIRIVAGLIPSRDDLGALRRISADLDLLGEHQRLDIPPLRERRGDIEALARHFLAQDAGDGNTPPVSISPQALSVMEVYPWPGNLSEMEDVIGEMSRLTGVERLDLEHLPSHIRDSLRGNALVVPTIPEEGILWQSQVESFERGLLEQALGLCDGRKVAAARRLGLKKDQMKYLCRKYGL